MDIRKSSRQRKAVLDAVMSTKCHPSAEWVYSEVKKKLPNISLGTVYRNLALLSGEGTIQKMNIGTAVEHFDGNVKPHYHVLCKECGQIDDIETSPLDNLNVWASEMYDGEISEHYAVFLGKCPQCKKNKI